MNIVEHMMEIHEEAWDELMGAKRYFEKRQKATKQECKAMYLGMATDELGHAEKLLREGDTLFTGADSADPLAAVWEHLKKRIHAEKSKIESDMKERKGQ